MKSHQISDKENKIQSSIQFVQQKKSGGGNEFRFPDNRSEAIAQRKMQEVANDSSGTRQLKIFQAMSVRSPGVMQLQINDADYNSARGILITANCNSASASHPKHTQGRGSPDGHGRSLVREAVEEFQAADVNAAALTRGMTMLHFVAVSNAAHEMGLDIENILTAMGQ
jgi:hypothetical protein